MTGPARAVREVTQTILDDQDPDTPGNCLQAAVASLLGLDLDAVPHFVQHDDWLERLGAFGQQAGYRVVYRSPGEPVPMGVAYGRSPRGVQHAVVVLDGVQVWDPHPSRAGLLSTSGILSFIPTAGTGTMR